jgi:glutamine amidotransferase/cyclase
MAQRTVHVLDYGAGNVRSLYNAIVRAGFTPVAVTNPADVASARVLVFPGVGSFGSAMEFLEVPIGEMYCFL